MTIATKAEELRVSETPFPIRFFTCDDQKLRAEARRRGVSVAVVVRELVHGALEGK